MTFQNDASFMSISASPPQSPILSVPPPIVSPLLPHPPPPEHSPEMRGITSLSPPPRRGSRQISVLQMEDSSDEDEDGDAKANGDGRGREDEKLVEFKLDVDSSSGSERERKRERKPLSLSPQASLEDVRI